MFETCTASAGASSESVIRRTTSIAGGSSLRNLDIPETPPLCVTPAHGPYHCVLGQLAIPEPSPSYEPLTASQAPCPRGGVPLAQYRFAWSLLILGSLPTTLVLLAVLHGRSRSSGRSRASVVYQETGPDSNPGTHYIVVAAADLPSGRQTSLDARYPSGATSGTLHLRLSRVDAPSVGPTPRDLGHREPSRNAPSSSTATGSASVTGTSRWSSMGSSRSHTASQVSTRTIQPREDDAEAWVEAFRRAFDEVLTAATSTGGDGRRPAEASTTTHQRETASRRRSANTYNATPSAVSPHTKRLATWLKLCSRYVGMLAVLCVMFCVTIALVDVLLKNAITMFAAPKMWTVPSTA